MYPSIAKIFNYNIVSEIHSSVSGESSKKVLLPLAACSMSSVRLVYIHDLREGLKKDGIFPSFCPPPSTLGSRKRVCYPLTPIDQFRATWTQICPFFHPKASY